MTDVTIQPLDALGKHFVAPEHIPAGRDEYHLRNAQAAEPEGGWRALRGEEIAGLTRNGNSAGDWETVLVADPFEPALVRHCEFHGLVRIGRMEPVCLEHHDLRVPVGLTHSRIVASDIGDNAAVHHVRYLAHYIIGSGSILLNVDEMLTTSTAKFGNGIVKEGEEESARITIDLINEAGGRPVVPFEGMICADAALWSSRPEDRELSERLVRITQAQFDARRGHYGTVGGGCVIKNCRAIKDVRVEPGAYIKGANKLKNITVRSSREEPTQIGEGVELVNGILGRGCRVFYGCKAVRFVLGDNSSLKYGARLIHSVLGDNSTVSCCEVLNDLIFPAHEQHHNNSFLIAASVLGQSNVAAGATIGSNHTSRKPDGEIHAGRGFWPGLCVSLKHNSRFASFTLLAKAQYAHELDVPLPFSLVADDPGAERLVLLPAYWWLYNMYALARNSSKYADRDTRSRPVQHVEFDPFAPDTAEEILAAMDLLATWTGRAALRADPREDEPADPARLLARGREMLGGDTEAFADLTVLAEGVERSRRPVVVLKPHAGYAAYRQMLVHYGVREVMAWLEADPHADAATLAGAAAQPRRRQWVNLGGQLVGTEDVEGLVGRIKSGELDSWPAVHEAYDRLWQAYPAQRRRHGLGVLLEALGTDRLDGETWGAALDEAVAIHRLVAERTLASRRRDYDDPFRRMVYDSPEQMAAVLGEPDDDAFIARVREDVADIERRARQLRDRL